MSFPHAAKGISKIFISELVTLLSGIAGVVMLMLSAAKVKGTENGILIGLSIAGAVFVVAFILKVIGYFQTSRDEERFTRAIIFAVLFVVLLIAANFLQSQKDVVMQWIYTIILVAAETMQLMFWVSTIGGMGELSYKCRDEGLVRRGNTILKILSAIYTLNVILIILNRIFVFFLSDKITGTISMIITAVVAVLSLIQYILYITYLANVSGMLKHS